ncbi:unnamed protein product [Vitrella brassicaformis CCMP3155]|uniref:RGS domain-containing protein n=2 Tax=Vitrella brassicaformis TaxID=1169539 RepID=A0A0G4F5D9_VITBC|nr:unnamed protein product [Vitrella brassicaformis CCMP3155]|eukprot:CEM07552.1 unnamed protein product [Vitrella brassicaformis CCMP3155]
MGLSFCQWVSLGTWMLVLLLYLLSAMLFIHRRKQQPVKSRSPILVMFSTLGGFLLATWAIIEYAIANTPLADDGWVVFTQNTLLTLGHPLFFLPYFLRCYRLAFVFRNVKQRANGERGQREREVVSAYQPPAAPLSDGSVATNDGTGHVNTPSHVTEAFLPSFAADDLFARRFRRATERRLIVILLLSLCLFLALFFMIFLMSTPPTAPVPVPHGHMWADWLWIAVHVIEVVAMLIGVCIVRRIQDEFSIQWEMVGVLSVSLVAGGVVCALYYDPWGGRRDRTAVEWGIFLAAVIGRSVTCLGLSAVWPAWQSIRAPPVLTWSSSVSAERLEAVLLDPLCLEFFGRFLRRSPDLDEHALYFWMGVENLRTSLKPPFPLHSPSYTLPPHPHSTAPYTPSPYSASSSQPASLARLTPPTCGPASLEAVQTCEWLWGTYLCEEPTYRLAFAPDGGWVWEDGGGGEGRTYMDFCRNLEAPQRAALQYLEHSCFLLFRNSPEYQELQVQINRQNTLRQRLVVADMI